MKGFLPDDYQKNFLTRRLYAKVVNSHFKRVQCRNQPAGCVYAVSVETHLG